MITFKSVEISNFLSYGQKPTVIDLDETGSVLIVGNNEDVGEQGSSKNGAGKSSSMQAILFALYGKGIDKLKADEFINITNGKKLSVALRFEKAGKEYVVTRKRKPSSLSLEVDGESITLDTMKNTENVIEEIVGIPYEVFMATFLLTPHRESFMAMSSTEQRSMVESMLSLSTLAKRAESLKLIKKDLDVDLKIAINDLEHASDANYRLNATIDRLDEKSTQYEEELEEKLTEAKEVQALLEELDIVAIEKEFDLMEVEQSKNEATEQSITLMKSTLATSYESFRKVETEIARLESVIQEMKKVKGKADSYFADVSEELVIEKEKGLIVDTEDLQKKVDSLMEMSEVESDFDSHERQHGGATAELKRFKTHLAKVEEELVVLKSGKCNACGQDYHDEDKIKSIEEEIKILLVDISASENEISRIEVYLGEQITKLESYNRLMIKPTTSESIKHYSDVINKSIRSADIIQSIEEKAKSNPYQIHYDDMVTYNENIDSLLQESNKELSDHKEANHDYKNQIDGAEKSITSTVYQLLIDSGIKTRHDITYLIKEKAESQKQIDQLALSKNPFTEEITLSTSQLVDVTIEEVAVKELKKDIEHVGYLVKLLTDNKSFVRKRIVDMYIPFVNKKINEYSDMLGLSHTCSINSDLSTDIVYMNKSVSYYNLSQGERLRVNLSTNLAFRDLITMLGKNSNILMIDEYFDGAGDSFFIQKAFNLIKGRAKHVMIISHRDEFFDQVDKVSTITKRNGFSTIS
ncbi:MAG: AAA family ATPase [Thiomicrorhabdus sp.]|jgi:DNA repair exonuclease SbcCD ATPase subunit|nr:AAA family ATPase [Thiomicrorhabdus sp.]